MKQMEVTIMIKFLNRTRYAHIELNTFVMTDLIII